MARSTPRYYPPKAPLWQGLLFLGVLCTIFYAALNHYAGNALHSIGELQKIPVTGQYLGAAAIQRLLALRALFSVLFCLLLGALGYRITAKIWAGAAVHMTAVIFMLWQDVPHDILLDNWLLAVGLALVVGLITLVSSVASRWKAARKR